MTKYYVQMMNMYNVHARMMNILGVRALEYAVFTQFKNCL